MSGLLTKFDDWLTEGGPTTPPAALVIREHLMPVEGADGVFFPPTFAKGEEFPGGYNIDGPAEGENTCLIDTVGSQANRIEPMFARPKYSGLIPQVVIKAGEKEISILEAAHRAGDALIRCSELQEELRNAFQEVLKGNAEPLAKIAPTSLVFGVWDSRDTQAKIPRLVASTIRAFNVRRLTRSAQFVPAAEYVNEGMLPEPESKAEKDAYAQRGFIHVPSSGVPGGIIATHVRRDATLSLAAVRLLKSGSYKDRTVSLQRYILGLALTAFTQPPSGYLRQGCNLVLNPDKPREFVEVHGDGRRVPSKVSHDDALAYAEAAATAFGVGKSRTVDFDKERAKKDVQADASDDDGSAKKSKSKKSGK